MIKNRTLFLFTSGFPYSNSEAFIETEIKYLSKSFKKIYIVPSMTSETKRNLPENVSIIDEYADLIFSKKERVSNLLMNPILVFKAFYLEIQSKGLSTVLKNLIYLLDYLAQKLIIAKAFKKNKGIFDENAVLYSYWFCKFTLALGILKFKNPSIKFITRAHGYDLYDEVWENNMGLPFRLFKTTMVDKVYCVSKKGQNYFKSKVPKKLKQKIEFSYLGVESYPINFKEKQQEVKTIVSCSGITKPKNLNEIVDILKTIKTPINWILFGDGPERNNLLEKSKQLPSNINFDFRGLVNNTTIIKFYQKNPVDLYISLSKSEGIPVSMMEAISFGIPILATKVGGVPEIVLDGITGFLVGSDDDIETKIKVFKKAIQFEFDSNKIKEFHTLNFEAKNNYNSFIQRIM